MKIVVINLERAVKRRRQVVAGLKKLELDFELYQAIDGRNLSPEHKASIDMAGFRGAGRPIRMGSIANWLSQRNVLVDLVEKGPDIMAVLEDDVTFSPELPSVLNALEESEVPFGIVFLHRGPHKRRFVPDCRLKTGHRLGWVRFSHFGSQGYVITREAASRFLERNPLVDMGIDRSLARYWHHGLMTYCLRPPVVHSLGEEEGYPSLIGAAPIVGWTDPFWKVRRYLFNAKEGAEKRLAFARLVVGSRGAVGGCREIFGPRPVIGCGNDSRELP